MRTLYRHIFIFSALIGVLASCVEEMEGPAAGNENPQVEFVARLTDYTYRDVNMKAFELDEFESDVRSLYFLLFDSDGNRVSVKKGNQDSFSAVFRTDEAYTDATVCCVANMRESFVLDTLTTLDALDREQYVINYAPVVETGCVGVPVLEDGSYAIPMIGVADEVNFTAIGGSPFAITLRRLFSKVVVNLRLDLSDKSSVAAGPFFRLSEYTVNNLPAKVALTGNESQTGCEDRLPSQSITVSDALVYDMDLPYTFSLYVPETLIEPQFSSVVTSQDWYTEKDQRYKPLLAEGLNAPYVTLEGSYMPNGADGMMSYELVYDIYLGENNFDSFSLRRNVLYNNNVTIKGFSSADQDAEVDHRVDMEVNGFFVNFANTSMLDSHYEVRPLKVRFDKSFKTEGNVCIEVLDADDDSAEAPAWIRMERPSAGGGAYCDNSTQRKYFTTDLVTKTLAESGKQIVYNPHASVEDLLGELPIWVYVDEYSASSSSDFSTEARRARIRVSFRDTQDETLFYQDFVISQRAVYPVKAGSMNLRTYGMEFFEELPSEGIVWGMDGVQLSRNNRSVYTDDVKISEISVNAMGVNLPLSELDTLTNLIPGGSLATMMNAQINQAQNVLPYYDFYNSQDSEIVNIPSLSSRDYNGYEMNVEIIHNLLQNHSSDESLKLNGTSMTDEQLSVISYCYNKNKRDSKGNIATLVSGSDTLINTANLHWYAPSITEMGDIVDNAHFAEDEFASFTEDLYWSCQPSYDRGEVESSFRIEVAQPVAIPLIFNKKFTITASVAIAADGVGAYLEDDVDRARATRHEVTQASSIPSSVNGFKNKIRMSADNKAELTTIELTTAERDSLLTILNLNITDIMGGNFGSLAENLTPEDIEWLAKFVIGKFDLQNLIQDFKNVFEEISDVDWNIEQIAAPEGEILFDEGNIKRTDKARVRCLYNPDPPAQYRRSPNVLTGGYNYTPVN